jgi:hypothetical protein
MPRLIQQPYRKGRTVDRVERLRKPMVKGLHHPDDDLRREAADEIERLRVSLKEIADNPCMDPEGNAEIARKALEQ